jgi:hypothetical protein
MYKQTMPRMNKISGRYKHFCSWLTKKKNAVACTARNSKYVQWMCRSEEHIRDRKILDSLGVSSKYIFFWDVTSCSMVNIHRSMEGATCLSTRLDDLTALNVILALTTVQIRKPTMTQRISVIKVTSCGLDVRLGRRDFSWPPVRTGSRSPSAT